MTKSMPLMPIASLAFEVVKHSGAWSVFVHKKGEKNHEFAYGGTARKRSLAIQKALSEFVERSAMQEFSVLDPESYPGSTGYAARPIKGYQRWIVSKLARYSALLEAKEKYVLHRWWKDRQIRYSARYYSKDEFDRTMPFLHQLDVLNEFSSVLEINVKAGALHTACLMIGFLSGAGFVVGSAAGCIVGRSMISFRATVEVMRNLSISKRLRNIEDCGLSPYLKKVYFQKIGDMDAFLKDRLAINGKASVDLPGLAIDEKIDHTYDHLYYVHRCIYKGQPLDLDDYDTIVL